MSRDIKILRDKLAAYLPEGEQITGLTPLTAGHSNETYVVEGFNAVLRLPPSTAPLLKAHDIITQGKVYQELGSIENGPPVPAILHICEDPQVLGDPFFVMEKIDGVAQHDYDAPQWFLALTDEQRGDLCHNWVTAIGSIAKVPPINAFGDPKTPEDEQRHWHAIAIQSGCPELASLIQRLLQTPAPRSGPPTTVHGDSKLTNLMFRDLQTVAVLDWELGYNGEPLSDLGYLLYFFPNQFHNRRARLATGPGMWTRDEIIPAWEQASGRSANGLIWYETAELAKMAGIFAQAKTLLNKGATKDQRMQIMMNKLDESIDTLNDMLPVLAKTCG